MYCFSVIAVSEELGALAMVQVSEQLGKEDKKNKHRRRMWLGGKNTQKAVDDMARRSNISERDEFTNLGEVELFEKFKLDFSVVYQCLHIYENLNIGDTFIQFYKESRKVTFFLF